MGDTATLRQEVVQFEDSVFTAEELEQLELLRIIEEADAADKEWQASRFIDPECFADQADALELHDKVIQTAILYNETDLTDEQSKALERFDEESARLREGLQKGEATSQRVVFESALKAAKDLNFFCWGADTILILFF